ncbi:MAG: glycosyltransferase family 1 protein, partial [Chloroflexota bacterium]
MPADATRLRVLSDILPLQVPHTRDRGIGRWTAGVLRAILQQEAGEYLHVLLGNADLPPPDPLAPYASSSGLWYYGDYPLRDFRADQWQAHVAPYAAYWQSQLARFAPHIVHVHNPFEWQLPPHSRYDGAPLIVSVHDVIPLRFPEPYLQQMPDWLSAGYRYACELVRRADHTITNSECSRRDIAELLGIEPSRISVALAGPSEQFRHAPDARVTADVRRRFGLRGGFVLCNSGYDFRKNLTRTLQSYARVAARLRAAYPLVLVCSLNAEQKHALRRDAQSLGIASQLVLTNYVRADELVALYHAATALFFPSLYEGFGLPVLDAMLCGLPVVTANVAALPEIAGDAAMLVNPLAVDEMANALTRVLESDSLRAELRAKGIARAATFSWAQAA